MLLVMVLATLVAKNSVTSERISLALAQFVRAMVSYQSKFDRVQSGDDTFTDLESRGHQLFGNDGDNRQPPPQNPPPQNPPPAGPGQPGQPPRPIADQPGAPGQVGRSFRCDRCHNTNAQIAERPENIGLDADITDDGAGSGRFRGAAARHC